MCEICTVYICTVYVVHSMCMCACVYVLVHRYTWACWCFLVRKKCEKYLEENVDGWTVCTGMGFLIPGALALAYALVLSPCVYVSALICSRTCVYVCIVYILSLYLYTLILLSIVQIHIHIWIGNEANDEGALPYSLCEHLYGKRLRNLILPKHSSFILILNADLLGSEWTWLLLLLLRAVTNLTTDRPTERLDEWTTIRWKDEASWKKKLLQKTTVEKAKWKYFKCVVFIKGRRYNLSRLVHIWRYHFAIVV